MPSSLQKLMIQGFTEIPKSKPNTWEKALAKHPHNIPLPKSTLKLVPLTRELVSAARSLHLNHSQTRFPKFSRVYETDEEFWYDLVPREGVTITYVRLGEEPGIVTDLISFWFTEYSVACKTTKDGWIEFKEKQYGHVLTKEVSKKKPEGLVNARIRLAWLYYTVAETVEPRQLLEAALPLLANCGVDTVNAMGVMGMKDKDLKDLGFSPGTGCARYYAFGLNLRHLDPAEIAMYPGI